MTTKRQPKMYPNKTDLDSPRIRFNWGFHDATFEFVNHQPFRTEHSNHWYAAGYAAGIDAMRATTERPESSTSAWLRYLSGRTGNEYAEIEREVYECEVGGLEHCLRHRADDYIISRAKEYAARSMIE